MSFYGARAGNSPLQIEVGIKGGESERGGKRKREEAEEEEESSMGLGRGGSSQFEERRRNASSSSSRVPMQAEAGPSRSAKDEERESHCLWISLPCWRARELTLELGSFEAEAPEIPRSFLPSPRPRPVVNLSANTFCLQQQQKHHLHLLYQ